MRIVAAGRHGALAPPLPVPYPALANAGLYIRHSQLSLTVAAPGVGKSMLWANLALRTPVPALYWSGDTDAHDVLMRAAALHTGLEMTDIDARLQDPAWAGWIREKLTEGRHVEWVFESSITAPLLAERMNAFAETHGEYPHLVVCDNLSNTVQSQGDELAEQKDFIKKAQEIARESKAHVALLAHAKGEYDSGTRPIPLGGVLNNVTKLPEVVLTLHRADESGNYLGLNITKNRGGRADPSASRTITFQVDFGRATVAGFRAAA